MHPGGSQVPLKVLLPDEMCIRDRLMTALTGESKNLPADPQYFRAIMTVSELWQGLGYSSIIYAATLSAVDQQLYEAAAIDGANRWQQTIHITIPEISSTIIIMLILKCGTMLAVGADKIIQMCIRDRMLGALGEVALSASSLANQFINIYHVCLSLIHI